ncbi:MAG: hypothetical protein AB1750_04550 [Chloroflexota bacterium]
MNSQHVQPAAPSPFWFRWLIAAAVFVLVFSLAMVVIPEPVQRMLATLYYSSPEGIAAFGAPAVAFITLLQGVLGAVMFGWGVALLLVALGSFRRGLREGWTIIAVSLVAWFIPDTTFSLWTGFWQNAALNLVFLLLFAIPLAATYRAFFRK